MIPKAAIEKAIEGGWSHASILEGSEWKVGHGMMLVRTPWPSEKFPDRKARQKISLSAIALNPTFWQALVKMPMNCPKVWKGKRCSAGEIRKCSTCGRGYVGQSRYSWLPLAKRFAFLILTGGDTQKFWDELLTELPK